MRIMYQKSGYKVGLETSSILPLVELTPRTLPLQKRLQEAKCEFLTDKYSIQEANKQIEKSYERAVYSLNKAHTIVEKKNMGPENFGVIFLKTLAENWWGREEALRWSDCVIGVENKNFWLTLTNKLRKKFAIYKEILNPEARELSIDFSQILSYWATPERLEKKFVVKLKIVKNTLPLEKFEKRFKQLLGESARKIRHNDVMDFYHAYSLYKDGEISEIWTCDQNYLRGFRKLFKNRTNEFSEVFENVRIIRIK
jgi:hypothetical protein